ncbi:hypothetical protein [Fodinibius sediminis]|uniref:Zinc-finger n=1 Tax=Fodinibius sediminis TaxID=1214077 RepID=A0A521E5U7_9BACT|nr:hypothetical protein [Fodinibius sediminis]SMO79277.1 hypothetical protein SAMN06265218_113101 [Fodinibius sediminis]
MDLTEFDRDEILTNFLTDYIDGTLGRAERRSFEEYLANNVKERKFVRKAIEGKKALSQLAEGMKSAAGNTSLSSLTATDEH